MNIHNTAANNKHVYRINQKRYKKRIYIYKIVREIINEYGAQR